MEAAEQDVCFLAMPNASMDFLSQLMLTLPADASRMLVAPVSAVRHVRHAGMVVELSETLRIQASCVLSLVAHTGRSTVKDLLGGSKLVSKDCWNVPFEDVTNKEDGAPEHADKKIPGELASYCTTQNVQDFTLTSSRPKETVYALIVISSLQEASGVHTYMVDKVCTHMVNKDNIPTIRSLLRKLARASCTRASRDKLNKAPAWLPDQTPYTAKKAKRLSQSPTEQDMHSPGRMQPPAEQ